MRWTHRASWHCNTTMCSGQIAEFSSFCTSSSSSSPSVGIFCMNKASASAYVLGYPSKTNPLYLHTLELSLCWKNALSHLLSNLAGGGASSSDSLNSFVISYCPPFNSPSTSCHMWKSAMYSSTTPFTVMCGTLKHSATLPDRKLLPEAGGPQSKVLIGLKLRHLQNSLATSSMFVSKPFFDHQVNKGVGMSSAISASISGW
mmetsp:Transcript_59294/g.129865  ORF Transcript_59294/g.129865 Transcript_59294/m.129865 type:complete len:202 (-) Transcript_59294:936-1541(-)